MQSSRFTRALGFRLAVYYFVIFLVSSSIIVGLSYLLLASSLQARDREAVRALTLRYASIYASGGILAIDRAVGADRLTGRYEPFFLRIVRGRSSVLYTTLPADWTGLDTARLGGLEEGEWAELQLTGDQAPLDLSGARLPDGTVMQVGKSSAIRREILQRFRDRVLQVLLVVLAAALAGGVVLTRSALAPLRTLSATIRQILSTGDIKTRVPVHRSSDPLDELTALFNELLQRLDTLVEGMRQALDNVAHDLRTPMTRLRAEAETALRGPASVASYQAALEGTLEETERLSGMLTTLMDISEAQTGAMRLQRTEIDVPTLLAETEDLYADFAESRGVVLAVTAPDGLTLSADHNRLRQALANLVDNAVKYTPSGGRVTLDAAIFESGIEIRVSDTGRGIAPDELPRIWDRLFRGDRSRSERGLGLGLSLVKAIVEAHGGSVAVQSTVGQGSTFTLRVPA